MLDGVKLSKIGSHTLPQLLNFLKWENDYIQYAKWDDTHILTELRYSWSPQNLSQ